MEDIINYIDQKPSKAIVYLLMLAVVALSGVVIYLFRDKQKQEVKNLDMLIRSLEALKNNAISFETFKEKLDSLLRKYG